MQRMKAGMASCVFPALLLLAAGAAMAASAKEEAGPAGGANDGTVVVAMRYLQIEGLSHSHLYLFSGGGRLIRQLTQSEQGQDADPVFSPDGKSVLYVRLAGSGREGAEKEWRLISVDGKNDQPVKTPPAWREAGSKPATLFSYPPVDPATGTVGFYAKAGNLSFPLKDGAGVLTLRDDPARREANASGWFPKLNCFRARPDEPEVNLRTWPVFRPRRAKGEKEFWAGPLPAGVVSSERIVVENPERQDEETEEDDNLETTPQSVLLAGNSPILEIPPLKVAFFTHHRGSTCNERLLAADLRHGSLYDLSPNGGAVAVLEGFPGFACVCAQRYLPLGDGRTVNCSYLDLWEADDQGLRRIRLAAAKVGLFYGASIRLSEKDGAAVYNIPGYPDP